MFVRALYFRLPHPTHVVELMLPVSNKATREADPGGLRSARAERRAQRAARAVTASGPATVTAGPLRGLVRDPGVPAATLPLPSVQRAPSVRVAEQLREHCADGVVLLHHRARPRVRPNIDHLIVSPSGVWVVHSRRNQGRVAIRKPLFGDPRLTVGGHERTDLLEHLDGQVGDVETVLDRIHPDVKVRSAICFVDTPAPLVRTLYLGSYLFFGSQALAAHLNTGGPLVPTRVGEVAELLEEHFPAA